MAHRAIGLTERWQRWELEAVMMGEYRLTLSPETHPLEDERRADQVRWRQNALAQSSRKLVKEERARFLGRVLTLGLWRR